MKEFFRFYRWGMNMKYHMALYYMALIFIRMVLDFFCGIYQTENLFLFEAFFPCVAVAVLEVFLFPDSKELEKPVLLKRTLLWFVALNVILIGSAILFRWFAGRPSWYIILLAVFLEVGILAVWIGLHIANRIDSKALNAGLDSYQIKGSK